ncbi:TPA: hypothetical protein ACH3X2_001852 [Trebouxia sp. C0005]
MSCCLSQGGDDDVDALLAQFALEEKAKNNADIREDVAPPSARVYASFTAHPTSGDIYLFGGEFFDGTADKLYTFADLYKYQTTRNIWSRIIIPRGPALRTSHQTVLLKQYLYVFGGELTSLNQSSFKHYRDLWRLDLESFKWEQLSSKGGPIARSGHRMVVFKSKLILFGGFHDDGTGDAKYFNDVWEYDTEEHTWACRSSAGAGGGPAPRGGCQVTLHGSVLFVFGGHTAWQEGKQEMEKVHDDVWALDLQTWQWEKVKKAGMAPTPRTSFALVTHKKRAIIFGGVTDQHGKGDHMFSTLHDELYQFNFDSRRWYPVAVTVSAKQLAKCSQDQQPASSNASQQRSEGQNVVSTDQGDAVAGSSGQTEAVQSAQLADGSTAQHDNAEGDPSVQSAGGITDAAQQSGQSIQPDLADKLSRAGVDKESALYKAAARIQSRFRGYTVRKAYKAYQLGGKVSELLYSPALYGIDLSAQNMPKPRARCSPMLAVVGNTLWLFGGTVEIALDDVSLDDLWALDLNKLDGWRCIKENTSGDVKESMDSDGDSDSGHSTNDSA